MDDLFPEPKPSKANGGPPRHPWTAATVSLEVKTWKGLPATRIRDLCSALAGLAEMTGLPAASVVMDPVALRETVLNKFGAETGKSKKRSQNILSCTRFVLERLDVIEKKVSKSSWSPAWSALIGKMELKKQAGLSSFAAFCTSAGIKPEDMTDQVLERFEDHLVHRTLAPRPSKRAGEIRGAWNTASKRIAGWPSFLFAKLRDRGQYILPLDAFPEPFQKDLAAFGERLTATSLDDLSDEELDAIPEGQEPSPELKKPLRVTTAALRMTHIRWAGSALVGSGVPIEEITSLASLVQPVTRTRQALTFLFKRDGKEPSANAMHVAEALSIIAKYHVQSPPSEVAKIRHWGKTVRVSYDGMTPKNEKAILLMSEPARLQRYFQLPDLLMEIARALKSSAPEEAAGLALRATAIRVLSRIPLRLGELIGLRLDVHLQRSNPPHGLFTWISIAAHERKCPSALKIPVSATVADMLDEWIQDYRPFVAKEGNKYLFPSFTSADRSITPQGMRAAIKEVFKRYLGIEFSPHMFRHLAGKLLLDKLPGHHVDVQQLLGHADLKTTLRAYCSADKEPSFLRFDQVILDSENAMTTRKPSGTPAVPSGAGSRAKKSKK